METKKLKIKGHHELTEDQIELINKVKSKGEELEELIEEIELIDPSAYVKSSDPSIDHRWLQEGRMDLQKGIMCLVRSIARPESF